MEIFNNCMLVDDSGSGHGDSDSASSICSEWKIVVANILPLHAERDKELLDRVSPWIRIHSYYNWEMVFHQKLGLLYVGCLEVEVEANEHKKLRRNFWMSSNVNEFFTL
ncbi:hypothetical protein Fot_03634 [Forsythia ovata]|uniref:DUF4283 domain-containing protein n=1 Tax=Forsythia ovata TaxID=205694 RepID=A0ABD1XB53_9LAMI